MRHRIPLLAVAGSLALVLAACAPESSPAPQADAPSSSDDGHGEIAGATELAEPALGLTTIDAAGTVTHLDLLDESVTELGSIGAPRAMHSDGRYLFAQTDAGLEIVDSGVWTWDHVDHFHYYRGSPRMVGTLAGEGDAAVATTNSRTSGSTGVYFAGSGEAVLLDTEALSKGELVERFRRDVEPGAGMIVPVGSYALVTEPGASAVSALTAAGEPVAGIDVTCPDAAGTIATRVGAVIGCSDGALLATADGEQLSVAKIAYPADTAAPPATRFANRNGRPKVAALAGSTGVWILDTRAKEWTLLETGQTLAAVTAVDDTYRHVLAVAADGRLLVLDGESGATVSATEPLVAASLAAGGEPVLIADQQRAYLSAPIEQALYEIDFADDARIARTFSTATELVFTAGTGR